MSLSTYADLKSAVANWLNLEGNPAFVAAVPDFIRLAETRFSRELAINAQETTSTGTLAGPLIAVPGDLVSLRRLTLTVGGSEYDLRYVSPEDIDSYANQSGQPLVFTAQAGSYLVAPGPDSNYAYSIYYAAKFDALSDSNTTNWLLTNAPDIYLYASLLEAEPFMKSDARIPLWAAAYDRAVAALRQQDQQARYPNANLYMRADRWA